MTTNDNDTPNQDKVVQLSDHRDKPKGPVPAPTVPGPLKAHWELHLHQTSPEAPVEVLIGEGYLKFGPAFTAIVEGPEDSSPPFVAVSSSMVKYIKRIVPLDGSVQATLSL